MNDTNRPARTFTKAEVFAIGCGVEALFHESVMPISEAQANALLAVLGLPANTAKTAGGVVSAYEKANATSL